MATAGIAFDVLEQILVRLEIKDLIRCKTVCKSWCSLILSQSFVKLQLTYSRNNDDLNLLGHRRVARPTNIPEGYFHYYQSYGIVGSSNGLVCQIDYKKLIVTNPLTSELKKVLLPRITYLRCTEYEFCVAFGYDPYIDDYKVIAAVVESWTWPWLRRDMPTSFYVFMLKALSPAWRLIGQVNYGHIKSGRSGVLCDGALHWFMRSYEKDLI
uniref:putative F-box protein At1g52490 n=1 Tax=Erigeron canadensis TaxID=72917 RepID=UPI001CB9C4AB|nr:putative F-box protein At1g52490 [Erigeron canadensis]